MEASRLVKMSPQRALLLLIPGATAMTIVAILNHNSLSFMLSLAISLIGLLPSVVVCLWGTLKFRSYYEVKRSKADLWVMLYATMIQVLALALSAGLFIAALYSYDGLKGSI